ncbi:MAG: hypothetical protein KGJ60_14370 [Verrucomicrobiota bacterium]|nr:hypothetical protein [Verrucomicrobiota bacterium]
MKLNATVRSERRRVQIGGNDYLEIKLTADGRKYFGTLRFTIGQNPDGDEGDQAFILEHLDNDDVFTWLPIEKGRKHKHPNTGHEKD